MRKLTPLFLALIASAWLGAQYYPAITAAAVGLGNVPNVDATNANNISAGTLASARLPTASVPLKGTTTSIGGGSLLAGACATGTVTVTGATTAMLAHASPISADPTNGGVLGVTVLARVSSSNTVTVSVCAPIIGTPAASTYQVSVFQ